MTREFSVKSGSFYQVFFNTLDLAAINSWILDNETTGENISKKDVLLQLSEELSTEYKYPFNTRNSIVLLKNSDSYNIRKTCKIGFCNENKTTNICAGCKIMFVVSVQ